MAIITLAVLSMFIDQQIDQNAINHSEARLQKSRSLDNNQMVQKTPDALDQIKCSWYARLPNHPTGTENRYQLTAPSESEGKRGNRI